MNAPTPDNIDLTDGPFNGEIFVKNFVSSDSTILLEFTPTHNGYYVLTMNTTMNSRYANKEITGYYRLVHPDGTFTTLGNISKYTKVAYDHNAVNEIVSKQLLKAGEKYLVQMVITYGVVNEADHGTIKVELERKYNGIIWYRRNS